MRFFSLFFSEEHFLNHNYFPKSIAKFILRTKLYGKLMIILKMFV